MVAASTRRGRWFRLKYAALLVLVAQCFFKQVSVEISNQTSTELFTLHRRTTETKPWLTVVLVEIRCHAGFALVLEQAVRHLDSTVPIHIWHSAENALYVQSVINSTSSLLREQRARLTLRLLEPAAFGFTTHQTNKYAKDYWYSRMLMSSSFYESVSTTYLLLLQSDALLCNTLSGRHQELIFPGSSTIVPFLGASTTVRRKLTMEGRTLIRNMTDIAWKENPTPRTTSLAHLNGGFSLRHVSWTLQCIQQHGNGTLSVDDDLFNYCLQEQQQRPLETQAFAFASDEGTTLCFDDDGGGRRLCPFGVHKPWAKKLLPFNEWPTADWDKRYQELQSRCPGLALLEQLQYLHQSSADGKCTVEGLADSVADTTNTYEITCQCP